MLRSPFDIQKRQTTALDITCQEKDEKDMSHCHLLGERWNLYRPLNLFQSANQSFDLNRPGGSHGAKFGPEVGRSPTGVAFQAE